MRFDTDLVHGGNPTVPKFKLMIRWEIMDISMGTKDVNDAAASESEASEGRKNQRVNQLSAQ